MFYGHKAYRFQITVPFVALCVTLDEAEMEANMVVIVCENKSMVVTLTDNGDVNGDLERRTRRKRKRVLAHAIDY